MVAGYAFALFTSPKGEWFRGAQRGGIDKSKLECIVSSSQSEEIKKLRSVSFNDDDQKNYLVAKIEAAIEYALNRHDWYEQQRTKIYQIGVTGISFFFLLFGLLFNAVDDPSHAIRTVLFGSIILALFSLCYLIVRFTVELDGDRSYRLISDIRFWYFRYNLPHSNHNSSSAKAIEEARAVAKQRMKFFERVSENFDIKKSIREDLEQIFILQVLQKYKSDSLSVIKNTVMFTFFAFSIQVLVFFGFFAAQSFQPA